MPDVVVIVVVRPRDHEELTLEAGIVAALGGCRHSRPTASQPGSLAHCAPIHGTAYKIPPQTNPFETWATADPPRR